MKKIMLFCIVIIIAGCTKKTMESTSIIESDSMIVNNNQIENIREIEPSIIKIPIIDIKKEFEYNSFLDLISLGYNSLNNRNTMSTYMDNYIDNFININGYSQYIIRSIPYRGEIIYDMTFFFEKEPDKWFSLGLFGLVINESYTRNYLQNMTTNADEKIFVEYGYYLDFNIAEKNRYEYKFNSENNIENISEYSTAGYWNTSEQIEQHDNGIMVHFRNANETRRYYNVQEEELLDYFLKIFVQKILMMLNKQLTDGRDQLDVYRTEYEFLHSSKEHTPEITDILCNMTKRELAILRNCLYAKHNYYFRNEEWKEFFQKYYDRNYQGQLTEEEALSEFTDNEKWLLGMIIEIENNF
jgi:hypothetical protein